MTTPEEALVAREMISKLVALAREAQDDAKLAMALHAQGHAFLLAGELTESAHAFDESRELSLRTGDKRGAAITLAMIGFLAVAAGDVEQGLPPVASAVADLEAADPARAAIALRLAETSRKFDPKRFDAALKAATRARGSEVQDELARAVEGVRGK
ncbi:hypothetical protein HY251_19725 [bacterium]|nr:hypothetical protein [bacterium]